MHCENASYLTSQHAYKLGLRVSSISQMRKLKLREVRPRSESYGQTFQADLSPLTLNSPELYGENLLFKLQTVPSLAICHSTYYGPQASSCLHPSLLQHLLGAASAASLQPQHGDHSDLRFGFRHPDVFPYAFALK